MPDPELGALIVRGRHLLGFADSSDADTVPNFGVTLGLVVFKPSLAAGVTLRHLETDTLVTPVEVTGYVRSDGRVVAPADGVKALPTATELDPALTPDPVVRLIAPQQGFDVTDWEWVATFKPKQNGPVFQTFTRRFTGAPDETVSLGAAAVGAAVSAGLVQVQVYDVPAGPGPEGEPVEPYPAGYREGIDYLLTIPDLKLWR